jgi:RNA polymerase sigma-70 factor, ECF subfamily
MASARDDPDLIDAARRGDRRAWEHLYRFLYPRLKAYLTRKVGRLGADDAVNETMTRAIAGIERFRPGPAGFDGWVFGIARNVAADHHRRNARDRRQEALAIRVEVGLTGWSAAVEDHLEREQDHARLRAAFERLGPGEREVLELRVVAGLSADQVAALTDRTPGAIRTSQSRALARLRELLETDRVYA